MSSSQTILLTSITGFLGAQILDDLVKADKYKIHGTVRNLSRGQAAIKQYQDRASIKLFEVNDLIHGDLSEALEGVDTILHVASPYTFNIKDNKKDLLDPAIEGTLNVLRQAQSKGVKRVVITSSFAAINNFGAGGVRRDYTYTADDWNPVTMEEALDQKMAPAHVYSASKKLAEKAAWDFAKQHPEMQITTMCPPMIYGPNLNSLGSEENIGTSSGSIWKIISGKTETMSENRLPLFCDARDVSKAHLLALEKPESIGKRVPLCGGAFTWEQAAESIREKRPDLAERLPKPNPDATPTKDLAKIDTSVAREALGLSEFIPWQKTLLDCVDDLLEQQKNGWKKH